MQPRESKRLKYSFHFASVLTDDEIFRSRESMLKTLTDSLKQYMPNAYTIAEIDGKVFVSIEENPKMLLQKTGVENGEVLILNEEKTLREMMRDAQMIIPPFDNKVESSVPVKYSGIIYALLLAAKKDFGEKMEIKRLDITPETVFGTENSPGVLEVVNLSHGSLMAMEIGEECAKYLAKELQREIETIVSVYRGVPNPQREVGIKKAFANISKRYGIEAFVAEKQEGNFLRKKNYVILEDEKGREIASLCLNDCSYSYNFLFAQRMFEREARDFVKHFASISSTLLYLKGRAERNAGVSIPAIDNETLKKSVESLFNNKVKAKVIDVDANTKLVQIPFGMLKVEVDNLSAGRIVEVKKPTFADTVKVLSKINEYRARKMERNKETGREADRDNFDLGL